MDDNMYEDDGNNDDNGNGNHDNQITEQPKTCFEVLVINPQNNTVKKIWDTFIYSGLGVSFCIIPFTLAFDSEV